MLRRAIAFSSIPPNGSRRITTSVIVFSSRGRPGGYGNGGARNGEGNGGSRFGGGYIQDRNGGDRNGGGYRQDRNSGGYGQNRIGGGYGQDRNGGNRNGGGYGQDRNGGGREGDVRNDTSFGNNRPQTQSRRFDRNEPNPNFNRSRTNSNLTDMKFNRDTQLPLSNRKPTTGASSRFGGSSNQIPLGKDWSRPNQPGQSQRISPSSSDQLEPETAIKDSEEAIDKVQEDDIDDDVDLSPSSSSTSSPLTASLDQLDGTRPARFRRKESGSRSLLEQRQGESSNTYGSKRDSKKTNSDQDDTNHVKEKSKPIKLKLQQVQRQVFLPSVVTVSNLARILGVKMRTLQNKITESGMPNNRPDLILKFEDAELLAAEFNLTAVVNEEAAFDIFPRNPLTAEEYDKLPLRPPVVTIMGHVDHGKTTLLDKLRSTSVAAGEAGGITQHVGAFSVPVSQRLTATDDNAIKTVTFLDTPGHAAFTAMRSRGAMVTDIVVLVVAADDGVMPQTQEVIDLVNGISDGSNNISAKKAESTSVQLVIALNKVDKPDANPEKVKLDLLAAGIELEEIGGQVPCVQVSGKTGQGLDELEETLATLAEMAELRAERDGPAEAYVIESRVDKGLGMVATVLVKRGALKAGDCIIAGTAWCKVRQILDSNHKAVKIATPGDPVLVTGWKELPVAGDELLGGSDEACIKKAVENRKISQERLALIRDVESINEQRRLKAELEEAQARAAFEERQRKRAARLAAEGKGPAISNPALPDSDKAAKEMVSAEQQQHQQQQQEETENQETDGDKFNQPERKYFNLIVKADFSGTVEAVVGAISGIGNKEAGVKIIYSGVGDPSESDVSKAQALNGQIVCFNVKPSKSVLQAASKTQPKKVEIHHDKVIYRLMDYVSSQVISLLPIKMEARVTGEALISQIFNIQLKASQSKNIAGCKVTNGTITKSHSIRILRGSERKVIYQGKLDQFKHIKKDVTEMRKGTECGMSFDGFQEVQVGDIIQSFQNVEMPRSL